MILRMIIEFDKNIIANAGTNNIKIFFISIYLPAFRMFFMPKYNPNIDNNNHASGGTHENISTPRFILIINPFNLWYNIKNEFKEVLYMECYVCPHRCGVDRPADYIWNVMFARTAAALTALPICTQRARSARATAA